MRRPDSMFTIEPPPLRNTTTSLLSVTSPTEMIVFLRPELLGATGNLHWTLSPFRQSRTIVVAPKVSKRWPVADTSAIPRPLGCVRPRCYAQTRMAAPESMRMYSGSEWVL